MLRDWYRRGLFIVFILYIGTIVILTPLLFNREKPTSNICGYIVSYPSKDRRGYSFYLKSKDSYFVVRSSISAFALYDYICLNGSVREIENKKGLWSFDREKYLAYKNVFYEIEIKDITYIKKSIFIFKIASFLRERVKEIINLKFDKEKAALILGIFLGEKEEIKKDFRNALINSGSMHLLVASGSNVAYIVGMVVIAFSTFGIRSVVVKLTSIIFTFIYVLLIGFDPPITRAFLMYIFTLVVMGIKRNVDSFQILILCAFVIVFINPFIIYDKGFQLSFFSVYGIITGYNLYSPYLFIKNIKLLKGFRFASEIIRVLNKIIMVISITFFAQLSILPFLLDTFGKISIISLISNIFLIPISFLIMVMTTLFFVFYKAALAGEFIYLILSKLSALFIKLCFYFSSFKFSVVYLSFPNKVNFIFAVALIFIFINLPVIDFRKEMIKAVIFTVIIGFTVSLFYKKTFTGVIERENYQIKSYIISKNNRLYLVNPSGYTDDIITTIHSLGFDKIDAIFITSIKSLKKKKIDEIKKFIDVEKIYLPVWLYEDGYKGVFPPECVEGFMVSFKEKYGYFNRASSVVYCDEKNCY